MGREKFVWLMTLSARQQYSSMGFFAPIAPTQDMLDMLHTEGYNAKLFIKGCSGSSAAAKPKPYVEDIDHIPAVRHRFQSGDRRHGTLTCRWWMDGANTEWMVLVMHVRM